MAFQSRKTKIYSILILVVIIVTITISYIVIYRILKSNSESNLAFKKSLYRLDQQLIQDYPYFLEKTAQELLDYKIDYYQKKQDYSKDDLEILWKVLFIKKDFYKDDYITEQTRRIFIDKVAKQKIDDFSHKYFQINILKYKLGMNNILELENYLKQKVGACDRDNLFLEQTGWDNVWQVGVYFDIVHFCKITFGQQEIEKLNLVLKENSSSPRTSHVQDHGINDVPVYINDCSQAKDENEEYHCLFFY
tara:strand:+ start:143 stop:889 length:747 start_codon:yes stop_codon:yes gene_type:complete